MHEVLGDYKRHTNSPGGSRKGLWTANATGKESDKYDQGRRRVSLFEIFFFLRYPSPFQPLSEKMHAKHLL